MIDDLVKRLWLHDCEGITREAADRIEELEAKLAGQSVLVKALFELLDITEESDEGRVFHPNRISSCRALDAEKLNRVLVELKHTLEDWG